MEEEVVKVLGSAINIHAYNPQIADTSKQDQQTFASFVNYGHEGITILQLHSII